MMRKIHYFLILFGLASLAGIFFIHNKFSQPHKPDPNAIQGTLLQVPRTIPDFYLKGIDKQVFTQEQLKGQWTLLFFGFTHCGSMCPTTLTKLAKMQKLLSAQKNTPPLHVVMITLDPKHDNLYTLKNYVHTFHPGFYGARGSEQSVHQLTQNLGIVYTKFSRHSGQNHTYQDIEHSGALMLFNPRGQLTAFFTPPHDEKLLAKDYLYLTQSQFEGAV